ncbi:hypothetical protein [Zhaonella formicivorans]|nr:hypothetical protein [Zhaonella formicivorans]
MSLTTAATGGMVDEEEDDRNFGGCPPGRLRPQRRYKPKEQSLAQILPGS